MTEEEVRVELDELMLPHGFRTLSAVTRIDPKWDASQVLATFQKIEDRTNHAVVPVLKLRRFKSMTDPRDYFTLECADVTLEHTDMVSGGMVGNSVRTALHIALNDRRGMAAIQVAYRRLSWGNKIIVDSLSPEQDQTEAFLYEMEALLQRYSFELMGPVRVRGKTWTPSNR